MTSSSTEGYIEVFRGRFSGILRWPELDALWARLRSLNDGTWYVYAIGEPPPREPVSPGQLARFVEEIDVLLRREHDEDYCGIVYVDNRDEPRFIKIFDPHNLGVVCGFSEHPPLPGWTISRLPPRDLAAAFPPPAARRRWWQRLFA
jgi:hypothetical protein